MRDTTYTFLSRREHENLGNEVLYSGIERGFRYHVIRGAESTVVNVAGIHSSFQELVFVAADVGVGISLDTRWFYGI